MTSAQQPGIHACTELAIKFYSAVRTICIYPPANPQVTTSTEQLLAILEQLFQQENSVITIGWSEQKILINGHPLSEKDHQRPQLQGLSNLFSTLQIHTLTFHRKFTGTDCIHFLELLSTVTGKEHPAKPLNLLLENIGVHSVSVNGKHSVALHTDEQTVSKNQENINGGETISEKDLTDFLLNRAIHTGSKSDKDLQHLLAEVNSISNSVSTGLTGINGLESLINIINRATSATEKNQLLENGSTALAELNPTLLSRMLTAFPEDPVAIELLDKTVEQLSENQLEGILLQQAHAAARNDAPSPLDTSLPHFRTEQVKTIEEAQGRIDNARELIELFLNPTPLELKEKLQRPEWSAPVLVAAIRHLAEYSTDNSNSDKFIKLLSRYEHDLSTEQYTMVADKAGSRLATLTDQELGRILVQQFKGMFGKQLYTTVLSRMSPEQFERITHELNFLAQTKQSPSHSAFNRDSAQTAYQRLMQSFRGQQLQTLLTGAQEEQIQPQVDQKQLLENIKQFISGNYAILNNDQVIKALPTSVNRLLKNHKTEAADKILIQMVTGLQEDNPDIRRGCSEVLGRTIADLIQARQWPRVNKLLPALEEALPFLDSQEAIVLTLDALAQLTRHYIVHDEYNNAINALNLLFNLTIRPPDNNPGLKNPAQKQLNLLANQTLLTPMLEKILKGDEESDNCEYLITRMGAGAAQFLMQRLSASEDRKEREIIFRLVGEVGKPARDALLHLLKQDAPWYVIRNIIRLFQDIGDPGCFTTISSFIHHEEQRVQQEVIKTLGIIGGAARKSFFLEQLNTAADELKPLVIRQLGAIHDEGIVLPLIDLLQSSSGHPVQEQEQLQTEICIALARLGSKKASPGLKKVTQTKDIPGLEDYSAKVLAAAESALHTISSNSQLLADNPTQLAETASKLQRTRKHDPLADKEAAIFRMVAQGDNDTAKQELYNLIVSCAEKKDFANAERLRERIYEIDPMALTEIIRSGDVIEKERTGAVSHYLLDTWSDLLDTLSTVEFGAIYYELLEQTFAPEELIVQQGEKNDALYFINHGSIKISYNKDGRDFFISSLCSGQIIGDNFFNASLWTVTLTALTSVKISVLERESFRRWQEEYPGLEAKLRSFYNACNVTGNLIGKKGLDRREHKRIKLSRTIQLQLTDHNNNPIGKGFRGEMADISKGGLAFLIRISKKDNTRLLLGRNMRVTIPVGGNPAHLYLDGLAISIQPFQLLESDYSVHIKFPNLLDEDTLQQILG